VLTLCLGAQSAWAAKPRVTLHVYDLEDAPQAAPSQAEAVELALERLYTEDDRLAFKRFADIMEPADEIARTLGEADIGLVDAEKAFGEMDLDKAKQLLKEAIQTYQKHLPKLVVRGGGIEPLVDAWTKLAKVRFFDGDQAGARDALRYAFVLDPKLQWKPSLFPPQMKKTVVEARLLFDTLGPGKLTIDSDPPGATVWLNGVKLEKKTPTDPVDAQPGPNFISYTRRGYAPLSAIFEHNGSGESATATQPLARYPGNPLQPLGRARGTLDERDTHFPLLKEACEKMNTDMLVLVRLVHAVDPDGAPKVRVLSYLYDTRADRIMKRADKRVEDKQVVEAARALSQVLLDGTPLDGVYKPPKKEPGRSRWSIFAEKARGDFIRFYEWNGFWYVVGGVAGAVVLTVVVGASVGAHQQQTVNNSVVLFGGQ
jgi:hypothetical protein